jgi:hypothetical protein
MKIITQCLKSFAGLQNEQKPRSHSRKGKASKRLRRLSGVCRKTICNWLCATEFVAEVDRLSCMIDISSRAERLRIAMRVVRHKVREDGTPETEKDLLDWLKYAQSETTGIKVGFSRGEVAEIDETINRAWRESVEAEVNRRLAARGLTIGFKGAAQKTRFGMSTRQRQSKVTFGAAAPLASHVKTVICTSVAVPKGLGFTREWVTVRKNGVVDRGVATTLMGC